MNVDRFSLMKSVGFLNYLNSKFSVCEANMGNLPHRTRLEIDQETGESILPMPKDIKDIYGNYAEIDDVISFKKASKCRIKLINMSCRVISRTRFTREYNSITRQLTSAQHPLKRVIVSCYRHHYLLKLPA